MNTSALVRVSHWLRSLRDKPLDHPYWTNGFFDNDCADAADVVEVSATRAQAEPVKLARQFHEAYERLAPTFGYETRAETRHFDPTSPNGRLMLAVCAEIAAAPTPAAPAEPAGPGDMAVYQAMADRYAALAARGAPAEPTTPEWFAHG